MESEPMLTPREKSPLPEKCSPEEDRTNKSSSSRTASPTHYQRAIPAPDRPLKTSSGGRTTEKRQLEEDKEEITYHREQTYQRSQTTQGSSHRACFAESRPQKTNNSGRGRGRL